MEEVDFHLSFCDMFIVGYVSGGVYMFMLILGYVYGVQCGKSKMYY